MRKNSDSFVEEKVDLVAIWPDPMRIDRVYEILDMPSLVYSQVGYLHLIWLMVDYRRKSEVYIGQYVN